MFSQRCRDIVASRRLNGLGVFGHIHRQYLVPGDQYANAGHLTDQRLEFIVIDRRGAEATRLENSEL